MKELKDFTSGAKDDVTLIGHRIEGLEELTEAINRLAKALEVKNEANRKDSPSE